MYPKQNSSKNQIFTSKLVYLLQNQPKMAKNVFRTEIFCRKFSSKKFFRRRKIENCKSFETRFAEVWRRSELCLGGERSFEVRHRRTCLSEFRVFLRTIINKITLCDAPEESLANDGRTSVCFSRTWYSASSTIHKRCGV